MVPQYQCILRFTTDALTGISRKGQTLKTNNTGLPARMSLFKHHSRRKFLGAAASLIASSPALLASDTPHRRSLTEMIFNDDPLVEAPYKPDPTHWTDSTITATWIGHATVLLNFFGVKIITDPVLSDRIGLNIAGLFTIGPRRLVKPALTVDELPPVDLILLSHAHMDHLDIPSLKRFNRTTPVVMAKNTYDVIDDLDFRRVYELDWGQCAEIHNMRVEALEVKHFGWRFPWEEDRSRGYPEGRSYNGYLLSYAGHHVVFGGDTAYHEKFQRLRERNISVDLAIMPIGAYDPWIRNHASPEQTLAMTDQMGASTILPIHWNTFIVSQEPTEEPIRRLLKAAQDDSPAIALRTIGETWELDAEHQQPGLREPLRHPSVTK
jgi:L-ascorbate metabolism protein UlaG (beta-lactamase superfamily)